ncbi:MAG: isopenicillin N synthase family oxygenase [Chloroflexi bacterium]|nr:isopenicillin N synthase family oxygenase [Chloroflexota bacterium]
MTSQQIMALPVLDISKLQDPAQRDAFIAEISRTAHEVGFFYIAGHGIPQTLIDEMLTLSRRFFDLPEEEKLKVEMINSPHFRGYTRVGMEITRGQRDWREQIDIGAEREALPRTPDLPAYKRLQGPNQWPATLPELRDTVLRYQEAVIDLSKRLLQAFALALGQPENAFESIYTPEPHRLMKIVRYPGRDVTESEQGVGAHKDSGFLTVLLQDVQSGLEVEYEGNWISAPPIRGTFIVNIGEVLEMVSDGYLRATMHRVVTPPAGTDRLSVPFFFAARLDATVPLFDLPPALAASRRGVERDPQNPLFREVGRNHLKSRLRSHPDVAQKHHADLL